MDTTNYVEGLGQENLVSREFQWEHCFAADEAAIKLYTTNSLGEDVELVFDLPALIAASEGFEEYVAYFKGIDIE